LINTVNTCKKCADVEKFIFIIVAISVLTVIVTLINGLQAQQEKNQFLVYNNIAIAVLIIIVTLIIVPIAKVTQQKQIAEAKAKAERETLEILEVKAKEERDAAEAKAKLIAEIGAGRVGATLGVPLVGKMVMPFAFCPAGSFKMGSPSAEDGRSSDEKQVNVTIQIGVVTRDQGRSSDEKQVNVTLSKAFWMAKTEVTQAQWRAVMGSDPSSFKGDDLPVESVSWDDAQEFIKKVNDSGVLPSGWKMVLPTEAQWEYACRAGETGPYSGGTIERVAWYCDNSEKKTHAVGTKKSNAWGLHDMHGNVWEWCADWYDDSLSGGPDPSGASRGIFRVHRGGSWPSMAADCSATSRGKRAPISRSRHQGFRPALVPSE
jgi:formylglycine-generating enzyme required for sulfatase activity